MTVVDECYRTILNVRTLFVQIMYMLVKSKGITTFHMKMLKVLQMYKCVSAIVHVNYVITQC
jgi:hypothetical protein